MFVLDDAQHEISEDEIEHMRVSMCVGLATARKILRKQKLLCGLATLQSTLEFGSADTRHVLLDVIELLKRDIDQS